MLTTEKIFDVQTGLETIIEREMTADELLQHEKALAEIEASQKAADKASAARQAVLEKLGLTADEAAALLG